VEQEQSSLAQNLYYFIQQRVTSDWTTEPGMAVLLTVITCGIFGLYIFYKLMERRDQHLARMANMVNTSVAMLNEKAAMRGQSELIGQELAQIAMVQREMYDQSRERGAALWLVIAILTGIGAVIGYYFIMDDMTRHDQLEAQFFTLMSSALAKLGLSAQASQAAPNIPERNFVVYLLLTLVTCGIFSFYWIYALVEDGNKHVEAQVQWEDFIYSALATA
jgi:hypothetical protein